MSGTHLTIATAGHIDHGKSTLVEALTGVHPDRLKEEQARGISIELGFAHAQIGDLTVSFVDVPGHERFVRHMLAGIGGIDGVLLIVAADESIMPQTREHLAIASLLDVPRGIVVVTKADLVDAEMAELVRLEVAEAVEGTCLDKAPVVAVSARSGAGLADLKAALLTLAAQAGSRDVEAPARLPVDRVFTVRGFGTVATGTLWTGRLHVDDEILVLPEARAARVRGLQVHGQAVREAWAGQRVAVNLAGIERANLVRGAVLAQPGGLLLTRRLDVRLSVLPGAPPLRHGTRVHVHLGTAALLGRVAVIATPETPSGTAREIPPGGAGWARLRLEEDLPVRRGDHVVLRSYSPVTTIAGGVIVDPLPPRRTTRSAAAGRLTAIDVDSRDAVGASAVRMLGTVIAEAGIAGVAIDTLAARLGVPPATAAAIVDEKVQHRLAYRLADRLVSPSSVEVVRQQVLALVDAHHETEPSSTGIPRPAVREPLGRRGGAPVVDAVIGALVQEGVIDVVDERLARSGRAAKSAAASAAELRVMEVAATAGLQAATPAALLTAADLPPAEGEALLRRLVREARLVKLGDLYLTQEATTRVVEDLCALAAQPEPPPIDVGWFKERYGVTRRTAIPLLEMLDRQRVTRRMGDARVLIPRP